MGHSRKGLRGGQSQADVYAQESREGGGRRAAVRAVEARPWRG